MLANVLHIPKHGPKASKQHWKMLNDSNFINTVDLFRKMLHNSRRTNNYCCVHLPLTPINKNNYDAEKNIAEGGTATQSSQHLTAHPKKAIDGNHDSEVKHGSCSTTNYELNPWWRLDLLKPHTINTVTITVRGDSYYKRIEGAEIHIGNSLDNNGNVNPR